MPHWSWYFSIVDSICPAWGQFVCSRVQTQAVLPRVRSEERSEEACSEERSEEGLSSARLNGVVLSSSDLNSTNLLLAFSRSNVLTRPTGQRKMPVWTRQRSVLRVSMTLWPYKVYGVSLQPNRYRYWCKLLCISILNLCGFASCSSTPKKHEKENTIELLNEKLYCCERRLVSS